MQRTPEYYVKLYATMQVLPDWEKRVKDAAALVRAGKKHYETAAWELNNALPWILFGILHYRESSCNFTGQLLNGEPYTQVTTKVPKGHGPWDSWAHAASYALDGRKLGPLTQDKAIWIAQILYFCEKWNGLGYAKKELHSPYIWSGTNHGIGTGKYTSDGRWSKSFVDKQVGCAPLLRALLITETTPNVHDNRTAKQPGIEDLHRDHGKREDG